MTVKEHYDNHLADFYSWMIGDFATRQKEFQEFLTINGIFPNSTKTAIDLGAAHGVQSVSLAKLGFSVVSVDFNEQLLAELETNAVGLEIETVNQDIRAIDKFADKRPELIICWGDTLTHLDDKDDVKGFIKNMCSALENNGILLLSFRDYSNELTGDNRFIPVKSDDTRILTCFLNFQPQAIEVTDLLHQKTENGWKQRLSSYKKVRIPPEEVILELVKNNMIIILNESRSGMIRIIAKKTRMQS